MGHLNLTMKRCKVTMWLVKILKFQIAGQICMLQFSETSYLLGEPFRLAEEILDCTQLLQKRICRSVGPSLAASLEPLAHHRNLASLSFSIVITLADVHLNWPNWFHFLVLEGGLYVILIDCMFFLSPFLDVTRMCMSTVSFLAQLHSGIFCLQNAFL